MKKRWLNSYLNLSSYGYQLRQKIVATQYWPVAALLALWYFLFEIFLLFFSLPLFLILRAGDLRSDVAVLGAIKDKGAVSKLHKRRKIGLAAFFAALGLFAVKLILTGFIGFFLLGVTELLADVVNWNFAVPTDYAYNAAVLETSGTAIRLKDLGTTIYGSTTNPGFNTDAIGWTYADWLQPAQTTASGAWTGSGGNPGGHVEISLATNKGVKTIAGYYQQAFTTTQSSPTTAVLTLDWSSITYTIFNTPTTYEVYAFVDSASGAPSGTSTAVWRSGEITGTTAWAASPSVDIASKIPTAGTYYLKFAAYVTVPAGKGTYDLVSGFDNVAINWSKITHVYDTNKPTTTPKTSFSVRKAVSWDSFSESASKGAGEIYYQLSADNGANWKYWNGSAWVTSTPTNYNTATEVNANISKFTTSTSQIKWRAYLSSGGADQVTLNNITLNYTPNYAPTIANLTPAQGTSTGYAYISYNLVDPENDLSSLSTYEYSPTGAFAGEQQTLTASTTDPAHSGVSGLTASPAGLPHTFVWDAKSQLGAVVTTTYVRLRANDGIGNGNYTTSTAITLDYVPPIVSNVFATQNAGTTTVAITYDLYDFTGAGNYVDLSISEDGGATWGVATSTVFGAVRSNVATGTAKTVYWQAKTDYNGHQKSNMMVRVRARDSWQNQGGYATSSVFNLDTLNPTILAASDLKAQPNAGDAAVLIGGSFIEVNPASNTFAVAINGGGYGSSTIGDPYTATPANQLTSVTTTLTGHDYVSKVSLTHTDLYGQQTVNENLSPSSTLKYVKPYTPPAPSLSNPLTNRLDLQINAYSGEASDVEYAILETVTNKFVQADGTLGTSAVWQTRGVGSNQWGNGLGVTGQVRVIGLSSPVANYVFKVKSRNPSDASHQASSESAYSGTAQITNTAPAISYAAVAQTSDGSQYVPINYFGTDGQGDICSLLAYQYSLDGSTWSNLTEKSGAGSSGISNLIFLPGGASFNYAWNVGADLPNTETTTARVRLLASDTLASSSAAVSSLFTIDTKAPIVSSVTAAQDAGAGTVTVNYILTEANSSLVQAEISGDGGATWTVTTSTFSGAIGNSVSSGNKTISWNAKTDYNNQYNTNLIVRVRARDSFGNQGAYAQSVLFTVDTKAPVASNLTAAQNAGANTFVFHYDLSEDLGSARVALAISGDSGATWTVATSTAAGDIGTSVAVGANKTITWDGGGNYNNQETAAMRFRLIASDSFSNAAAADSGDFSLDTLAPRFSNLTASEPEGATNVVVTYDLADNNSSYVWLDISADNGATWTVATSTLSGALGAGQSSGSGKTITWAAGVDLPGQNLSAVKVRVRAQDSFSNLSGNATSSAFLVDTLAPAVSVAANLQAQPLAGDTSVLVGGSFVEAHPSTNQFAAAINGGDYAAAVAGSADTASPADRLVAIGKTLDGGDYVSAAKITHTDKYNQSFVNENLSPAAAYRYVKPYTPPAPTVDNPTVGTVDVLVNKNSAEISGLEYAIYESSQNKYVQNDGSLGVNPVWRVLGTTLGQWGDNTGAAGKVRVNGLAQASYLYTFQTKSRNSSDISHQASSDSALSSSASSANQSPAVTVDSVTVDASGGKYATINYTGSDLESDASSLISYQYSRDNVSWAAMTEKSRVGSEGVSGLNFSTAGTAHVFAWDIAADLGTVEDSTVYVRLRANDGTTSGNYGNSSAFAIDTVSPVISGVSASQTGGTNQVSISYSLADASSAVVALEISGDGGATWTVATSTANGDLGSGIAAGSRSISWNPGADLPGVEISNARVRLAAIDAYGNVGAAASSGNFAIDTKAPVFANVSASQVVSSSLVAITYDLGDVNNSTVSIEVSADGGATWTVAAPSVTGDVGSGVAPGTAKTIIWDAGADYPNHQVSNMQVRLRAVDAHSNATGNVASNAFALNTQAPIIASLMAEQTLGADLVAITYNLFDANNVTIGLDISSDGGATWTVATSTASGDVGSGVTPGLGKSISWNAGVDFAAQQNDNMKVRIRATNIFGNSSLNNLLLGVFSVDTLAPAVLATADLTAQPQAGETAVTVGGSFMEANPNANYFSAAISGGAYAATTTGQADTAAPADQAIALGVTLTGADYVSKVKITASDDYGHNRINENLSPAAAYRYVKPYTPPAPVLANPTSNSVEATVSAASGEAATVPYAIYEVTTGQYVQAGGALGASAVWQTLGTASGQWGSASGVAGKITVTGLASPIAQYSFKVISRNPADSAHAASSQSDWSSEAAIENSAPVLVINSAAQQSGGFVRLDYTGTDAESDNNNLIVAQYSVDGANWFEMTEKTGVGSEGVSDLNFSAAGSAHVFAWDAAADLGAAEYATVYVRLQSTDTLAASSLAVSSAFTLDNRGPIISSTAVTQAPGSGSITFNYSLADLSSSNFVAIQLSADGGATWTVATTTAAGDVGGSLTAGVGKAIAWDASTDYDNQENAAMQARFISYDAWGNAGAVATSAAFTVDTRGPVVSSLTAAQAPSSSQVNLTYNLADLTAAGNQVEFNVSADNGATWTVATSTAGGDIGSGQTAGAKTFVWQAGTDFAGQDLITMRIRLRARDYFGNYGSWVSSAGFSLDTKGPVISAMSASQILAGQTVDLTYTLDEQADLTLEYSADGGVTWLPTSAVTGAYGAAVSAGSGKAITWDAATDFANQENNTMRLRLISSDQYGNAGLNYDTVDFSVDTLAPRNLTALNKFSSTPTTVTVYWPAITEANFDHFEIWHGSSLADVNNRAGTAAKWNGANDAALNNVLTVSTVITGLSLTADYYAKIFAIDDYGNSSSPAAINVYATTAATATTTAAATTATTITGAQLVTVPTVAPSQPIINPVASLLASGNVAISGLADPLSRIDLYDNGVFLIRLSAVADSNGEFSQTIAFNAGDHILTARAVNFSEQASELSSAISFTVASAAVATPIILSPADNTAVEAATPTIIGVAEANQTINLVLDGVLRYAVKTASDGSWQFVVPASASLANGAHSISASATDSVGRQSAAATASFTKVTISPSAATTTVATPLPAAELVALAGEATELAGVPVPQTSGVSFDTSGQIITFSGTALPNQEVLVFVHSSQAIIYRTVADANGNWLINHSQTVAQLAPGEHSIYSVAVDKEAKVKSRPSIISSFTVRQNWLGLIFSRLNWPTTAAALIVAGLTLMWVWKLNKTRLKAAE